MNNPQQTKINIDISQTTPEICESCKHDIFIPAFKMRKLSALLSPAGKETIVPINVFACAKCGHINEVFLPKEEDNDTL